MEMLFIIFIIVQISLLLFLALHDIVSLPPLNDIPALGHSLTARSLNALLNSMFVIIPLAITLYYQPHISFWPALIITALYATLTIGTICAWWIPYIFGSSTTHKREFMMFKNTHHFLPARGDNVIPNTLHVLLHLQVWFCFGIAIYFLLKASSIAIS